MANDSSMTISLRKWHLILGVAMGLLIPSVSVVAAYYSKQSAVTAMIHAVEQKMKDQQLENERRFAKQEDLKAITKGIQSITNTLTELKTDIKYLRNGDKKRR